MVSILEIVGIVSSGALVVSVVFNIFQYRQKQRGPVEEALSAVQEAVYRVRESVKEGRPASIGPLYQIVKTGQGWETRDYESPIPSRVREDLQRYSKLAEDYTTALHALEDQIKVSVTEVVRGRPTLSFLNPSESETFQERGWSQWFSASGGGSRTSHNHIEDALIEVVKDILKEGEEVTISRLRDTSPITYEQLKAVVSDEEIARICQGINKAFLDHPWRIRSMKRVRALTRRLLEFRFRSPRIE